MSSGGYKYVDVRAKASGSSEEFYQRTLARLQKIQNHLDETPRCGRLKGKVCVITGVGSLKGIGSEANTLHRPGGVAQGSHTQEGCRTIDSP